LMMLAVLVADDPLSPLDQVNKHKDLSGMIRSKDKTIKQQRLSLGVKQKKVDKLRQRSNPNQSRTIGSDSNQRRSRRRLPTIRLACKLVIVSLGTRR
jgi:hypothetical protein